MWTWTGDGDVDGVFRVVQEARGPNGLRRGKRDAAEYM
jgi:hypothetical protein